MKEPNCSKRSETNWTLQTVTKQITKENNSSLKLYRQVELEMSGIEPL